MSILLDLLIDIMCSPLVRWPKWFTYFVIVVSLAALAGSMWGSGAGYATLAGSALLIWLVELILYLRRSKTGDAADVSHEAKAGRKDAVRKP